MNLFDGKRALVLGGGSARGLAHIGVIKVLEKYDIDYDMIVGTSMGAFIGAMYLQRENIDIVEQLAKDIINRQFARIVGFEKKKKNNKLKIVNEFLDSFNKLLKYAKLIKSEGYLEQKHIDILMNQVLLDIPVSDMRLPFSTVAVDLIEAKPHVFLYENSKVAVKSSIAIPGAISPVTFENMILVDGGVSSIVPVREARSLGAKRIVAIDVSRRGDKKNSFENAVDVMFRVDAVRGELLKRYQLAEADKVIALDHNEIKSNEYSSIEKLVSLGEQIAEEHIDEIRELFSSGIVKKIFSYGRKKLKNNKFASVDFGSNTIIVSIYDVGSGKCLSESIIHHDLLLNLKKNKIDGEGLHKLNEYVKKVKRILAENKVYSYKVMGTAIFRELADRGDIQLIFRTVLGKPMMVLSQDDEARLAFLGSTYDSEYKDGFLAVLDVGGASSELIMRISPIRKYIESIPIGSKKLGIICEKNGIKSENKIREKAREYIRYYKNTKKLKLIVAGGTITTIAGLFANLERYSKDDLENINVTLEEIDGYISEFSIKSVKDIENSLPYDKKRASHIIYGLIIVSEIMHMYGLDEISVATGGIRKGMFLFSTRATYL